MGEIVDFPDIKQARDLPQSVGGRRHTVQHKGQDLEELAARGGEAFNNLNRWRRGIENIDREKLATNMDRLLREYGVKPRDLAWENHGYRDRESFNRDLSRMRLPDGATPGRRLMAHKPPWIQLLQMIHLACTAKGEQISLEGLAERLTRGTSFHPIRKTQSFEDKILYKLKLWANAVDEQYGVLRTYKRLADLRAQHYHHHLHDIGSDNVDSLDIDSLGILPVNYFDNIPNELIHLFSRRLGDYTSDDWDTFLEALPEGSRHTFVMHRESIESWNNNFDPARTLFYHEHGEHHPQWCCALGKYQYLPRWYLGRIDYHRLRRLSEYGADFPNGSMDPLLIRNSENYAGSCYLVLYPNFELSRLIPYLLQDDEECSFCLPLSEDFFSVDGELYFPPAEFGTESVSKLLLPRIEEASQAIRTAWESTAQDLLKHPYFKWHETREARIDQELAQITSNHGQDH